MIIGNSGLEDGLGAVSGNPPQDIGGNMTLLNTDTVFVNPIAATSAPTSTGDYHLADASLVINQGDNTAANNAGLTTDFEGDNRIQEGTVDMGADENDPTPAEVSPSGAVQALVFTSKTDLAWEDGSENGSAPFNIYSGSLMDLGSNYGNCLQSGLAVPSFTDTNGDPPAGDLFFYIVTGVNVGREGTMGFDSTGTPRVNSTPCP